MNTLTCLLTALAILASEAAAGPIEQPTFRGIALGQDLRKQIDECPIVQEATGRMYRELGSQATKTCWEQDLNCLFKSPVGPPRTPCGVPNSIRFADNLTDLLGGGAYVEHQDGVLQSIH